MESYANWDATRFIEILSIYRIKHETKTGFAIRMGFKSHKIFQDWRKGQKPRVESLLQIKEKLGISQEHFDILTGEVYGIVFRKCNNTLNYARTSEVVNAVQLPINPVVEKVLALQRGDESEMSFLNRVKVPPEKWEILKWKELKDTGLLEFTSLIAVIMGNCDKTEMKKLEAVINWFHKNRQ